MDANHTVPKFSGCHEAIVQNRSDLSEATMLIKEQMPATYIKKTLHKAGL